MPTPTTDFSIFDGQELVTYDPLSGSTISNVPAVRRPLTQSRMRNVESFVNLAATDFVFHLDGAPLANTALAAGDTVIANSVSYQVLFVERQSLKNTVAAVCRPPAA
ncbi:MAG TPA: hypothetical protein VJ828_17690 [Lacipirellulaceae bacterium]|nr:hypothetical protein [Lacipirellulaceae bacterium]